MRGYYLTSEKWALEAIKSRRVKLSLFNEMNDPFELLGMELKTKRDRAEFYQVKKEMNETIGVICFSRSWNNPVLWSHYGDRHKGLCLGFDLLDEWTYEVGYQGERLSQKLENELSKNNHKTLGRKLLTTKYDHWRYEDEVRMILNLDDMVHKRGLYFLPFCNALRLREVIIGVRCDISRKDLKKAVSSEDKSVRLIKSRLAFRSYKIVRNKAVKLT